MDKSTEELTVFFDYEEIINRDANLDEKIERAFGPEGLGLCIVKNVPNYVEKREKLLPLGSKLANLPKEDLDKITFEDIQYSLGWSHGKEKFKGREDFSKGSFYGNAHLEDQIPKHDNPEVKKDIDYWPSALPELKLAFKDLGQLIINTGIKLSHHIDKMVEKKEPKYEKGKIERIIKEADNVIGRLLHYFPREKGDTKDAWCGLHNDLGTLTGLCSAMYLDKDGKQVTITDEESGLYCVARNGKVHKVKIPKDCLAFQIGETMQIHTGGHVIATPHFVKIGDKIAGTGICRNTLAVFMEPRGGENMKQPEGIDEKNVIGKENADVPLLSDRWDPKQKFRDFHDVTFKAYL